jgi:hypothetical protein
MDKFCGNIPGKAMIYNIMRFPTSLIHAPFLFCSILLLTYDPSAPDLEIS